jgi:hypothetical protein
MLGSAASAWICDSTSPGLFLYLDDGTGPILPNLVGRIGFEVLRQLSLLKVSSIQFRTAAIC